MKPNKLNRVKHFIETLFVTLFGLIALPQIMYFGLNFALGDAYEGDYSKIPCYVVLVTLLFFSFSFIRAIIIFDHPMREQFLSDKVGNSLGEKIRFLITRKEFIFRCLIIGATYFILPLHITCNAVCVAFDIKNSFTDKIIPLAVLLMLLLSVSFFAYFSACKYWNKFQSPDKYSDKAYFKAISKIVVIYMAGGTALAFMLPYIGDVLLLFIKSLKLIHYILIAAIIVSPGIFRYIRACFKRRSFIKELKKLCKGKGLSLSEIKYPFLSLLFYKDGESFNINVKGKNYSCKLISSKNKRIPLSIYPNGMLAFTHALRIRKVNIFEYSVTRKFGYISDNQKILIINPTSKSIYMPQSGKMVEIDNGYAVGDYKIYTGTAFLRAVDIDALEGQPN